MLEEANRPLFQVVASAIVRAHIQQPLDVRSIRQVLQVSGRYPPCPAPSSFA